MTLEDSFDARSMLSKRRSVAVAVKLGHAEDECTTRLLGRLSSVEDETMSQPPTSPSTLPRSEYTVTSGFDFDQDLEASLAYRRAQRETMDFSFRSSVAWSNGISTFSGLTLSDVSVLSVIALPICAAEISNAHHYTFGNREPSGPQITPIKHEEHVPITTVNSLLYECLEIAIQLSHICPGDIFWKEGLYSSQEHPFEVLRRILTRDNPYLRLLQPRDGNGERWVLLPPQSDGDLAAETQTPDDQVHPTAEDAPGLDALLRSGDVGLLRVSLVPSMLRDQQRERIDC